MQARTAIRFTSLLILIALIAPLSAPSEVDAKVIKRNLPRAGFQPLMPAQGFSSGGKSRYQSLEPVSGLHLTEGRDRGRNASPTDWYDPGEPELKWQWVRWERRRMPLKVWISPGLMLPDVPFSELKNSRPMTVAQMIMQSNKQNPFEDLPPVSGWSDELGEQVASGIELWKPMEQEGIISFDFTPYPREANILVFFNQNFQGATEPGGVATGALTCAQAIPFAKVKECLDRGSAPLTPPVVIEMSLGVNSTPEKLRANTAHEFGHALGIKAHSPYRQDIMHVNRIVEQLSTADKNTLRRLYKATTQWVL